MAASPTLTARIRAELARTKAFKAIGKRVEDGRVDVTGAAVEARALCLATLQEATKKRIAVVVAVLAVIFVFGASSVNESTMVMASSAIREERRRDGTSTPPVSWRKRSGPSGPGGGAGQIQQFQVPCETASPTWPGFRPGTRRLRSAT